MTEFRSQRQAKEYLVDRIVAEAQREGTTLSEVERKMLYFSETDWTLPGILEINEAFERECDQEEYEQKIALLVRKLQQTLTPEEQEDWGNAVLKLCDGDHYLLMLIDSASSKGGRMGRIGRSLGPWLPILNNQAPRKPGDLRRLVIAALAIATLLLTLGVIRAHFE